MVEDVIKNNIIIFTGFGILSFILMVFFFVNCYIITRSDAYRKGFYYKERQFDMTVGKYDYAIKRHQFRTSPKFKAKMSEIIGNIFLFLTAVFIGLAIILSR